MEDKKINWLSIISLSATVLLSIFKDDTNYRVIYPIIGVIVVVVIINLVLSKTKSNKNLSNTAVISKTKKYTNYLWKIVKANKKQMKKEVFVFHFGSFQNLFHIFLYKCHSFFLTLFYCIFEFPLILKY